MHMLIVMLNILQHRYPSHMPTTIKRKILSNLTKGFHFTKFFLANIYKYCEITEDLPIDLSIFSAKITSSLMIRQNFYPPNFSYKQFIVIMDKASFIITWRAKAAFLWFSLVRIHDALC